MTPARARTLDPGIEQGVAVSTSRDLGACDPEESPREGCTPVCGVVRRSSRIWIIPVGDTSLPVATECASGLTPTLASSLASVEASTNSRGEGVWRLEPGLYLLGFGRPVDRCVRCGAVEADEGCRVAVEQGQVSVRALVF